MFKVLFGFFVGAIVMLFILMPGKVSVDNIINPEKRAQAANFENPAQTIETIAEETKITAYKIRDLIAGNK